MSLGVYLSMCKRKTMHLVHRWSWLCLCFYSLLILSLLYVAGYAEKSGVYTNLVENTPQIKRKEILVFLSHFHFYLSYNKAQSSPSATGNWLSGFNGAHIKTKQYLRMWESKEWSPSSWNASPGCFFSLPLTVNLNLYSEISCCLQGERFINL